MWKILTLTWRFLKHPWTHYTVAWLVALSITFFVWYNARRSWDSPEYPEEWSLTQRVKNAFGPYYGGATVPAGGRADGNPGHNTIDFGGQYLFGRMLVKGYGRDLYNGRRLWQVAHGAWDYRNEEPDVVEEVPVPRFYSKDASVVDSYMGNGDREAAKFMTRFAVVLAATSDIEAQILLADAGIADPDFWRGPDNVLLKRSPPTRDDPAYARALARFLLPLAGATDLDAAVFVEVAQIDSKEWWETPANLDLATRPHLRGPLYPPINAFVYAPLGLLDPYSAYFAMQAILIAASFVAAFGVSYMTKGKMWVPFALIIIVLFPCYRGGLQLGQNSAINLAILVWGWALAIRGRPIAGGIVWGLFAYKPVWAIAFYIIPLLTARWRMLISMTATGIFLAVATLPWVGIDSWISWLKTGAEASKLYEVDPNWIRLSRDLHGIIARYILDFEVADHDQRRVFGVWLFGWVLWWIIMDVTVRITLKRGDRRKIATGMPAGFLFLGAWVTCYHFMYYDLLLGAMGVMLLLADREVWLRPFVWYASIPARPATRPEPTPPPFSAGARSVWVTNSFLPYVLIFLIYAGHLMELHGLIVSYTLDARIQTHGLTTPITRRFVAELHASLYTPFDTLGLIALWAWAGYWTLMTPTPIKPSQADTRQPSTG